MFDINDKTAIITGAGKGIGESIARLFATQGAPVHILDLDQQAGTETVTEIKNTGREARFYHTDVADQQTVTDTFDGVVLMCGCEERIGVRRRTSIRGIRQAVYRTCTIGKYRSRYGFLTGKSGSTVKRDLISYLLYLVITIRKTNGR